MRSQKIALTAFLFSPVVVIALLMYTMMTQPKHAPQPARAGLNAAPSTSPSAPATRAGDALVTPVARPADAGADPGADRGASASPAGGEPVLADPESLDQGFVIVVEDKSGLAKPESPIYLAGNVNNWNPADDKFKLQPQSDMKWRIVLPKPRVPKLEFKFTRGSWDLEELKDDMSVPGNRTLAKIDVSKVPAGEQPKIELTVPHWADEKPDAKKKPGAVDPYRALQVTGLVRRLQVAGGAGTAPGTTRDLFVWLPPGYDEPGNADKTYPVLYMHDGQNIFEQPPGVPGEWKADETATQLVTSGQIRPVIIVAVPNSGAGRNAEYLPIDVLQDTKPQGDAHVEWLVTTVLPRVERSFRVKTGPEATAVGGSSLGACISLHAAVKHPEVFGSVLLESLPLRSGDPAVWLSYLNGVQKWPRRVYLGMGDSEYGADAIHNDRNIALVQSIRELDQRLERAGLGPDRRLLVVGGKATHTESAWAQRLPDALKFLFPPPVDTTK